VKNISIRIFFNAQIALGEWCPPAMELNANALRGPFPALMGQIISLNAKNAKMVRKKNKLKL
jgi:hypothetical protein